ncbi:NADH-ubiquinone oxidoreductase 21kDa subunit [Rhizophagus irregularis DAOM 181602=DAOM 197198]|uniref:NADH dehydrogenase [ubiquinone] iron-sulfur protein 4, mitochondrial n=2 Tax=Rhizophagus irregularis TaxID=588596 RepID=A0A2P4P6X5_RHIID|nr:NADH-ubiquinone oxidoreductase 21kDa subunit [Rhizophagus irregularis DAOM 181602=DAOM 197198]POG61135.1 NADH-ubiquinone oxidoreductase 21kDa subunit [Rhizophagus irregularis DAOM 181602=DAOM 197198]|eukprot:XP_025168001.1 NADH-ubiquinone oxidoreductase 21kDa subunit [Rhizophagus irregularis DAOM 181602=DAOM 197198]
MFGLINGFCNQKKKIRTINMALLFKRTFPFSRLQESKNEVVETAPEKSRIITADIISGAPKELRYRTVRIYKPTRTAMQSGEHNTKHWRLDFDILEGGGRWENPLIGWASSSDYMQALRLKFKSKEDAIYFAEKQGWDYYVQDHIEPKFRKKVYADNFKYSPGKLRIIKTK